MSQASETSFRELIRKMIAAGTYPGNDNVKNATGQRNSIIERRTGIGVDQTKWRIEEVEAAGFDWSASKKARQLVRRRS